jgi:hypothetical protein
MIFDHALIPVGLAPSTSCRADARHDFFGQNHFHHDENGRRITT